MVCPRCGGSLSDYELGDAETVACDDCSYIGVSVDHTSADGPRESWDEAISRFYEQHQSGESEEPDLSEAQLAELEKIKPTYAAAEGQDEAAAGEDDTAESDGATAPDPSD